MQSAAPRVRASTILVSSHFYHSFLKDINTDRLDLKWKVHLIKQLITMGPIRHELTFAFKSRID